MYEYIRIACRRRHSPDLSQFVVGESEEECVMCVVGFAVGGLGLGLVLDVGGVLLAVRMLWEIGGCLMGWLIVAWGWKMGGWWCLEPLVSGEGGL